MANALACCDDMTLSHLFHLFLERQRGKALPLSIHHSSHDSCPSLPAPLFLSFSFLPPPSQIISGQCSDDREVTGSEGEEVTYSQSIS